MKQVELTETFMMILNRKYILFSRFIWTNAALQEVILSDMIGLHV